MKQGCVEKPNNASPGARKVKPERAGRADLHHPLLRLQRATGNRAVQRLLREQTLATDAKPQQESTQQEEASQAGLNASTSSPPDDGNHSGREQQLDSSTRAFMESRFSHDFSQVRVHADSSSARLADQHNAHAVTSGNNIYFERGGYSPGTSEGRSVLAHELAHVVQNERGGGGAHASEASLEAEASAASERAAAGQTAQVRLASRAPALKLSRAEKTALGAGLGAVIGGVAAGIGLGIAQAAGATLSDDLVKGVLLGGAGLGLVVGGLIGLFKKEEEEPLPAEEEETPEEKAQPFQERFQRWLRKGLDKLYSSGCTFPYSGSWKYDDRYWEQVDDPQFVAYKPKDIPPADAIDRLFQYLDRWDFDCALYPEVAALYAYRHALGKDKFNERFSDLKLRQHSSPGLEWEFHSLDSDGPAVFNTLWDSAPVGSKVMWTNRSSAANGTAWKNENAIKRVHGVTPEEHRYDAHPLGANLSEKAVMRGLAENAADFPSSGDESAKQAYVDTNIFRNELHLLKPTG